jgi:exopolysaccharide biosynthesis protein
MHHQYLAEWFYSDNVISDVLAKNSVFGFEDTTNLEEVQIVDYSDLDEISYANDYERAILEKASNNNDYKIISIQGEKYSGYLAVIYDPSRVEVATTKYLGKDRSIFNYNFRRKQCISCNKRRRLHRRGRRRNRRHAFRNSNT